MTNSSRDTAVVALACTAQFVDVVGVTLLIVALPAIQHDLQLSEAMLSWVAAAYALVFGGVLVPGGWAADLLGRRTTFIAGSAVVAAGSLVCAVAGTGVVLVAGRALQGLGAAAAVPAALALLLATLPPGPRRSRALGLWTVAGAAGGAFGFVLGGVVTQLVGWRWLFVAIGPVELLVAVLAPFLLVPVARRVVPLDLPGVVLVIAAPVLLILGLTAGLGAVPVAVVLVLAALAGIGFVMVERRVRAPLVPPSIWAQRSFRLGTGVAAVLTATTSGANVIGTLFLQHVRHLSGVAGGACFLLFSAGVVMSSTLAPAVLRRLGPRTAMATGLAVIGVSMAVQALGVRQGALVVFLVGLALSGLGLGVASVASTAHGTAEATESTTGTVGGLLNAAAQIGTAVGIAMLLTTATSWSGTPDAVTGQVAAYTAAAVVACTAAVVVSTRNRRTTADLAGHRDMNDSP